MCVGARVLLYMCVLVCPRRVYVLCVCVYVYVRVCVCADGACGVGV